MQPTWLIEAGVYGAEAEPLLAEIRRQGMVASLVPHRAIRRGVVRDALGLTLAEGTCVLGYGTFPFAREIQLHGGWTPGAWAAADHLDCTAYYPRFGMHLLNREYVILPGLEAIRQQDWLFARFARFADNEQVFARPSGCEKLFTGRCLHRDDFAAALAPTRYDPATLVVISSPKSIDCEWRLVVAENRVVAGSQYSVDGSRDIQPGCPTEVTQFATAILNEVRWSPDPIFMLDVAEAGGRYWVVELNGFSCSWLYACDVDSVVGEASRLATVEWSRAASGGDNAGSSLQN